MISKRDLTQPPINPEDTVRLDRRNSVFAQIEAALLAEKLALEDSRQKGTGTDPYNSSTRKAPSASGPWNIKTRR